MDRKGIEPMFYSQVNFKNISIERGSIERGLFETASCRYVSELLGREADLDRAPICRRPLRYTMCKVKLQESSPS